MGYPKSHSLSSCYLSDSHFWGIPVGPISGHAHRNLPGLSVNEGVDKYPVSMLEINLVTWQCFASPSMLNVQELSHALFKCGSLSRGRNPKEWVLASIFQYKHISIFISLSLYIYISHIYLLIFHICILYIYIIYIYISITVLWRASEHMHCTRPLCKLFILWRRGWLRMKMGGSAHQINAGGSTPNE